MKISIIMQGHRCEPHLLENEALRLIEDYENSVLKGKKTERPRYYLKPEQVGAYIVVNPERIDAIEVHP